MSIKEIKAKSILRKRKRIDSWFVSHYGMNLYRGCIHDCVYCDGRAEGYYVESEFGKDVEVKASYCSELYFVYIVGSLHHSQRFVHFFCGFIVLFNV